MVEVVLRIPAPETVERIQKFIDQKNKEMEERRTKEGKLEEWETPWTIEDAVYVLMMRGLDGALKSDALKSGEV